MSNETRSSQVTPEELYDNTTDEAPEGQAVGETQAASSKDEATKAASAEDVKADTKEAESKEAKTKEEKPEDGNKQETKELKLERPKDSLLTDSAVQRIAEIAKKQGLTQEQADELLQSESKSLSEYVEIQKAELQKKAMAWVKEIETDKEIGGDSYNESVELARRAVDRFATPELKKVLNSTGLGNHPELVRTFVKIGKEMADDKFINASTKGSGGKSLEDIFYPKN